ncbi:MAG: heavy metal translocating P-type ATPase [Bacilli bacterium]
MRKKLEITGMSCASCAAKIESTVEKLDGIREVNVNLLKNIMSVDYDDSLDLNKIIKEVENLGFKVKNLDVKNNGIDSELNKLKQQLVLSIIFTIPLVYIAMGEMLGFPIPKGLSGMENAMKFALVQLLLVLPIVFINKKYFISGFKNLYKMMPNMDSLIALGSSAAIIYGIYAVYKIYWGNTYNDLEIVRKYMMSLYFESGGAILTLITLGKFLEAKAKGKTSEAIFKLMELAPNIAIILKDGKETEVFTEDLKVGDCIVVKAGQAVAIDGVIIKGNGYLDESAITGESMQVEKSVGQNVIGGTFNTSGYFVMEVSATGDDTTLSKIISLVDEATSSKAPIAKLADKVSGIFVGAVVVIAIVAMIIWVSFGYDFEFALSIGISILVISCPCALGLATPAAIMVGTGKGAKSGVLIKSASALEELNKIDTIFLDKTGTITKGKPQVTDVITFNHQEKELMELAYTIENNSLHPLANAIIDYAAKANINLKEIEEFENLDGRGIKAIVDNKVCYAGNANLMNSSKINIDRFKNEGFNLSSEGKTVLYFARDNVCLGLIAVADTVKKNSAKAINLLKSMKIEVIMLTGDNQLTAKAIGKQVGVSSVIWEVLPDEKDNAVKEKQDQGRKVAMVGDGINDAPSLVRSNVGIAIGAGTDIAIESADVVLMKSDLLDVVTSIKLSRSVMRNIKQNLFWAFIYNAVLIPVAAGALFLPFNILLNPMIAALAMSFSSVSVVLNALRLKFIRK